MTPSNLCPAPVAHAESALPLLLPAVEAGIISGNWRIRQSSVELLGDLLFKVGLPAPPVPVQAQGLLSRPGPPQKPGAGMLGRC